MKMHPNCQGNHLDLRTGVSRRDFLYVGMAGGLGLTLPDLLRLQAAPMMPEVETFKPIADSVIHIYLPGGMAQHESWDPKPFAAPEYRGPYSPIKTSPVHATIDPARIIVLPKLNSLIGIPKTTVRRPMQKTTVPPINSAIISSSRPAPVEADSTR